MHSKDSRNAFSGYGCDDNGWSKSRDHKQRHERRKFRTNGYVKKKKHQHITKHTHCRFSYVKNNAIETIFREFSTILIKKLNN